MAEQELIDELVGAAHGNFERVERMLTDHPELVNASARWGETPIEAAAQMGRRDIVDYLRKKGAHLDICTAAMLGRVDDIKKALEADPGLVQATGAHGIPVLYYPMIHAETGVAELLLEKGADPNAGNGTLTALHGTALFDQPEMARWLLSSGALAEVQDFGGNTPLAIAREKGHAEVVAILQQYQ
ncbi:MAG: ankyrin repeat domain-containing protein [Chloroflexota bacterium]|nr:ankyrin repeat domain-containing protein [Chloroflexota bacterium]